jgi:ABC-2 type transport system permease protein
MNQTIDAGTIAAQDTGRKLSPSAVRSGGLGNMLLQQIRTEFLKMWRIPAFSAPTILFPLLLFLLFGAPSAAFTLEDGTSVGKYLLASFCASGLLGVTFFSFGLSVAGERGQGWGKLMRATPMPPWIYFAAKLAMGLMFSCLILALLFPTAVLVAGVRMPAWQWLALFTSLVLGVLPLTTIGFTLGYWAGPNSAGPIANLLYLPLSFASGLWQPVEGLPLFLQQLAPYLPPYHYGRIAWYAIGSDDGNLPLHIAWLLGTGLVFGALAIWGYWRDQGKQYG